MRRNKPYAIYRFNQHYGKKRYWERCGQYSTPSAALQALMDLTKRSKKKRIFCYCILPNEAEEKWLLIKEHENLLKSAR